MSLVVNMVLDGPGWYGLVYPIIFDIKEYNKTHPDKSQQIEIFQIKEKFENYVFT